MSSFRKFGGTNRSASGNIVRHEIANQNNLTISNQAGLNNSKIVTQSHIDLSCLYPFTFHIHFQKLLPLTLNIREGMHTFD